MAIAAPRRYPSPHEHQPTRARRSAPRRSGLLAASSAGASGGSDLADGPRTPPTPANLLSAPADEVLKLYRRGCLALGVAQNPGFSLVVAGDRVPGHASPAATAIQFDGSDAPLLDHGAAACVLALAAQPALTRLDLGSNVLGDVGAWAVASAIGALPLLQELNLSRNRVGLLGLLSLASALASHPCLRRLHPVRSAVCPKQCVPARVPRGRASRSAEGCGREDVGEAPRHGARAPPCVGRGRSSRGHRSRALLSDARAGASQPAG